MPRLQNTLSLCLGLVAAGSLLYAWRLHGQLAESEAGRAAINSEQSRLQKRVETLEKDKLPLTTSPTVSDPAREAAVAPTAVVAAVSPPPRENERRPFVQSLEMQKVAQLERRGNLDVRFAALFRRLNLPPAELEKLKDLLVERQSAASDVYESARSVGGNNRDNRAQLQALVAESEAQVDKTIEATFGSGVYQQYKYFEQSAPQRAVVSQIERRLSYSATPLSTDQSDRLVALLASPAAGNTGTTSDQETLENGPRFRSLDQMSPQTLNQSLAFLSSTQVAALQQLRAEVEQRAQLRQQAQAQARAQSARTTGNPTTTTSPNR